MIPGSRIAIYPAPDLKAAKGRALAPVADVGAGLRIGAVTEAFGKRFRIIQNAPLDAGALR